MTPGALLGAPPPHWPLRVQCAHRGVDVVIHPGGTAHGAQELRAVSISTEIEGSWILEIDDEPILPDAKPGAWSWSPGFFAGEVVARLIDQGSGRSAEYRLDVSPDPNKLGSSLFSDMLKFVWDEAPELLIGEEPGRRASGSEGITEDPLLMYGRLRRWGPAFVRAMGVVTRAPITRLRRERRRLPIHLVRRSDRRTAMDLARTGLLNATEYDVARANVAELLDTPAVEPTLDNPANRTMLALLQLVLRKTRACTAELERRVHSEAESATRTAQASRWSARQRFLRGLELSLRRIRLSHPFVDLPRAEVSPAGLTAISGNPIYGRAHRTGWLCSRTGFAGQATLDEIWLPPTWEVYERWCWVRIRRDLEADGFAEVDSPAGLPSNDASWSGVHPDGRHATLMFQPRFSPWKSTSFAGAQSLSAEFRPDLVLLTEQNGEHTFEIFDAKYRTSRSSVLDGMRSAHIYHDALRYRGRPPDRARLLVPAGGGAPWLEDPSFHDEHRVGVIVRAPT